jgi:hypothetical protein
MQNPKWWTKESDSGWERVKAAFRRDWDQTKHDFGGKEPDTDQDVNNTVKQAVGKEPIPPRRQRTYEEVEPAYRFGYGARSYYEKQYPKWDNDLESQLRKDWEGSGSSMDWETSREAIRRGWEYKA